jgi:hypothetical protein
MPYRCYQKIEIGRQDHCKFFQNDHDKTIQMKKNDVLFYGMAYLIKSEKRDSEKAKY